MKDTGSGQKILYTVDLRKEKKVETNELVYDEVRKTTKGPPRRTPMTKSKGENGRNEMLL